MLSAVRPPLPARHHGVHAAGVVADHAAERAARVRRRVGPERQAVRSASPPQVVEHRARLDARRAPRGVELENAVEVREKSSTTATLQHWPARTVPPPRVRTGAPCSRHDRDRRDDVVDGRGNDDADRHLAVVGGVGRVEGPAAGVEADLAADLAGEGARERGNVRPGGSRTIRGHRWAMLARFVILSRPPRFRIATMG